MNKKDLQNPIREFLSKDGNSPITEANLTKVQLDKREDYLKQLKKNKKELVKRYGKDAESVMYGRATNLAKKAVSEMNKEKLKELVRKSLMNEADIETMADKIGGEDELSLASNLLDDFESKLKSHDWFYMMSDDNRAYTKGSAEESELKKLAKQLASMGYGDDATEVYDQYNKFDKVSFESYITPTQPFIPMYKRKQMGLDETEFSKEFDNDPALKGGQKKLPDALQKAIVKKEKGVKEDLDLGHEEKSGTPSEGMHNTLLSYIKQDARGTYPKDYNKYFTFLRAQAKPMSGPNKPQIWVKFLKDLVKNNAVSMDDLVAFSKKGYNDGKKGIEGLAGYLYKQGTPEILRKIDNLSNQSNINEDIDLGHEDNEPHMIKGDLYRIGKYAMELYAMVEELEETGQEIDFPAWWQAMITDSKEQMVKSKHYLDFELKEPAIDAAVDALTGERPNMGEPEPSMMEAEIGKDEILAGKIMKALKDMANKDASDQNNLKQARIALNKGNMDAAKKIAKPYLTEKIAKQLKEYSYDDFSGSKLIANTPIPTDINIFKKFFPTGVASMGNAKTSLQASDNSGIKDRMGRYAPMFAHVQYHEFEDQTGEKYRAHQTQYYNSNFDKQDPNFNPSVTDLTLFKLASPDGLSKDTNIGSILVKTDAYIKDLDKLNISKRAM